MKKEMEAMSLMDEDIDTVVGGMNFDNNDNMSGEEYVTGYCPNCYGERSLLVRKTAIGKTYNCTLCRHSWSELY